MVPSLIQVSQVHAQFIHRAEHVGFYGAHIQAQNLSNLFQAHFFAMPQSEHRALPIG
jgi:hypothetical protein